MFVVLYLLLVAAVAAILFLTFAVTYRDRGGVPPRSHTRDLFDPHV